MVGHGTMQPLLRLRMPAPQRLQAHPARQFMKGGLLEQGIALGILQIDEGILQELYVGPVVEDHFTVVPFLVNMQ